jgi:hypothetical protein
MVQERKPAPNSCTLQMKTPGRAVLFAWPGELFSVTYRQSLWHRGDNFGRVGALDIA